MPISQRASPWADPLAHRMYAGVVLLAVAANASGESPYRFDDDLSVHTEGPLGSTPYDRLKYLPLGGDSHDYVSLGADLRERVESSNVQLLGFRYRNGNTYDLHRMLVYADLHLDRIRFFLQLGDEMEVGRAPSSIPTDVDRGDLAQGFADYRMPLSDRSALTMRAGRFEMSFDDGALVSLRDGPNTRQTWEGVHTIYEAPVVKADAFAVHPVAVNPGWFDDNAIGRESLWGLHVDVALPGSSPVRLSGFYFGNSMPEVRFSTLVGHEHTNTFGARLLATWRGFDGSVGAMAQTGMFENRAVRAWSSHLDAGWTFREAPWTPRIGVRGDVLSGGGVRGEGVVHTFNALYPNYSFSTEATIESPSNLIESGITVDLEPIDSLTVQYKLKGLWRQSLEDAFYGVPGLPLVRPANDAGGRYSASEQQLRASWWINRHVNVTTAVVHVDPASFLRASRAVPETFAMAEFSVRL